MIPESRVPGPESRLFSLVSRPTFSFPTRIYWEDTDGGGVVYHAQYLAFLERARTEWLRARGHGQARLRDDHNLVFAVRAMRIDFIKPARLDDLLSVSVELLECRKASLLIRQEIRCSERVLLSAEVRIAALSADEFRPRAIPSTLYDELKSLEVAIVENKAVENKE